MSQNYNINKKLNEFFYIMLLKKYFLNKLEFKLNILKNNATKNNYQIIAKLFMFLSKKNKHLYENLIASIIVITFSKSNIFVNVISIKKIVQFSVCAGNSFYKGKTKKARILVLKSIIQILETKLKFFKNKPYALHLKNVSFTKQWIIVKFKSKFFIKIIKNFIMYSHNGCRLAKLKRKK